MRKKTRRQKMREMTRKGVEEDPEFQIAPMIDILLVLLVFFMSISSTETLRSDQNIKLPAADGAADATKNPSQVIVNIAWSAAHDAASIEVNQINYPTPEAMTAALKAALSTSLDTRVLIRADSSIKYEFVKQVIKTVGAAEISNVTFSVIQE